MRIDELAVMERPPSVTTEPLFALPRDARSLIPSRFHDQTSSRIGRQTCEKTLSHPPDVSSGGEEGWNKMQLQNLTREGCFSGCPSLLCQERAAS